MRLAISSTSQRPVVGNHPPLPNEMLVGHVVLVGDKVAGGGDLPSRDEELFCDKPPAGVEPLSGDKAPVDDGEVVGGKPPEGDKLSAGDEPPIGNIAVVSDTAVVQNKAPVGVEPQSMV